MNTHYIETTIAENGKLSLQNLPFKEGDEVKIVILKCNVLKTNPNSFPLKGTVISYDTPFEPATSSEDWEALK